VSYFPEFLVIPDKNQSKALVACIMWPLLLFILYVSEGMLNGYKTTIGSVLYIIVIAIAPFWFAYN
jgi:hypothetical protein